MAEHDMDVNGVDRLAHTKFGDGYILSCRTLLCDRRMYIFSCRKISCPAILNLTCDGETLGFRVCRRVEQQ